MRTEHARQALPARTGRPGTAARSPAMPRTRPGRRTVESHEGVCEGRRRPTASRPPRRRPRSSRLGDSSTCVNADANGASTNSNARDSQPPTRLVSTNVTASSTADVCVSTSRSERVRARARASASSSSRRQRRQQAGAHDHRGAPGPAADREEPRKAVVDQVQLRRQHDGDRRDPVDRRSQQRRLGERERPGPEHAEQCPIADPRDTERRQQRSEREQRRSAELGQQPAHTARDRREEQAISSSALPRFGRGGRRASS